MKPITAALLALAACLGCSDDCVDAGDDVWYFEFTEEGVGNPCPASYEGTLASLPLRISDCGIPMEVIACYHPGGNESGQDATLFASCATPLNVSWFPYQREVSGDVLEGAFRVLPSSGGGLSCAEYCVECGLLATRIR